MHFILNVCIGLCYDNTRTDIKVSPIDPSEDCTGQKFLGLADTIPICHGLPEKKSEIVTHMKKKQFLAIQFRISPFRESITGD